MKREQPWRGARPKKKQRSGGSFLIQNNRYAYDLVGNILKVENQLPIIRNALGGASSYEYQYDNLNRLTRAKGNYTGELTSASYELKMSYNNLNSITKKELNHLSGGVQKGYTLDYNYNNPAHPHAPSEIMEMGKPKARTYQYDGNGNPLYYEESKSFRAMVWDEENRLRGINDNGKLHLYTYDHTGERAVKSSGESSTVVTNGLTSAVITHMDDYTAYVNPYFVVQKGKFTKHYFEGSARIVSKLGEGTFVHKNTGIMAGGIDYIRQNAQMQEARDNYIRGLKVPPGPPTQHGIYASPEWTGQPYPSLGWQNIRQDQEPPEGWPRPPKFNEPGDVPGPPVQYGDPITSQTVKAGYGFVDNGIREKNLYFYHPDHLGSSSYITDREGRITQHTEYIAFGEVLFEEHSTSKTMPYLFNGKELDSETGLYYYGARYYDPRVSIFLNVDPLAEKYPHVSPYTYTLNNPIKFIDPDGQDIIISYGVNNKQNIKLSSVNDIQKLKQIKNSFVQSVYQALNTMKTQEDVIKALNSKNTVHIVRTTMGSEFNDFIQTILWNETLGAEGLTTKEILSPASVLVHELNHFNLWDVDEGITLKAYQETMIEGIGPLSEYKAMEAETKSNNNIKIRNNYDDVKLIVTKNSISKEKVRESDIPQKKDQQLQLQDQIKETIKNSEK